MSATPDITPAPRAGFALANAVWQTAKAEGMTFADVMDCCDVLVRSVASNSGEPINKLAALLVRRLSNTERSGGKESR